MADQQDAHSANTAEMRVKAEKMVATQTTAGLVSSFALTDALLDGEPMPATDYLAVCETRGWIIDELVRRGEEARIGL